jgi:hypothetical protein
MKTIHNILKQRLLNQHISGDMFKNPEDMVRTMTAVQAQDFLGSLWGIGFRVRNARESDIEQAIADKSIIRTWLLRGTLHFVSTEDIRWILDLIAPKLIASNANILKRKLNLDNRVFERSKEVIVHALEGDRQLLRNELYNVLESANISTSDLRGLHILHRLALEGIICFGPRSGRQHTFVLLDEWIPKTKKMDRDESLGELILRYFTSHGPATIQDFRWWSGLTEPDTQIGLDIIKSQLVSEDINNNTYWFNQKPNINDNSKVSQLLPSFDEYIVGYKDRNILINKILDKRMRINDYIFNPTIIFDGEIIGTWKRTFKQGKVIISLNPFILMDKEKTDAIKESAKDYANFINMPFSIEL